MLLWWIMDGGEDEGKMRGKGDEGGRVGGMKRRGGIRALFGCG